jgi:hypothetical protein
MEDRRDLYRFFPPFLNDQYFSREEKAPENNVLSLISVVKGWA